MRDRQFIINSIKMDLFRIVTAAGNLNNPIPLESINAFMTHAIADFSKTPLTEADTNFKGQLESLKNSLNLITDPHTRLRWAEDVLTIRCRL
jgi:hypothetical protein